MWKERIALLSVKMAEAAVEETTAGAEETVESNDNLEATSDGDLWGEILTDHEAADTEELDIPLSEGEEAAPDTTTTEAEVPAVETVVEVVKDGVVDATAEEVKPVPVPAVDEQPAEQTQTVQELTPEQKQAQATQLVEARGKVLDSLSDMYALTDDESETLQLEPEKVLPRLAAQLHLNITEALQAGINSQLPQMIKAAQKEEEAQESSVNAFYESWPALKDVKYEGTVLRVMQGYKGANPNASQEQIIREGGAAAMVALHLPITQQGAQEQKVDEVVTQRPVQPAMPGSTTVSDNSGESSNAFTSMFLDAIEEDI